MDGKGYSLVDCGLSMTTELKKVVDFHMKLPYVFCIWIEIRTIEF